MSELRKITIIEGPPPTFELVSDVWSLGLTEGPHPKRVAMCRVRTTNGPALVERCHRAWRERQPIALEYRSDEGLTEQVTIIAARWVEQPEGYLLLLWVCLDQDEIEVKISFEIDDIDDDPDEGDIFDFNLPT